MRRLAILPPLLILTACGFLLTGQTDPANTKAVMQATGARGCIYAAASATPWADAKTIILGTWGTPAPALSDCWTGLPRYAP